MTHHWLLTLAGVQLLGFIVTFALFLATGGVKMDYEEFCTLFGGSFLWFVTIPLAFLKHVQNKRYHSGLEKKATERENLAKLELEVTRIQVEKAEAKERERLRQWTRE